MFHLFNLSAAMKTNVIYHKMKFSSNWNNKLNCKYFTTIRPACYNYKIGDMLVIESSKAGVQDFKGAIISRVDYEFDKIPSIILFLDSALDRKGFSDLMKRFYKDEKEYSTMSLLLIQRLQ